MAYHQHYGERGISRNSYNEMSRNKSYPAPPNFSADHRREVRDWSDRGSPDQQYVRLAYRYNGPHFIGDRKPPPYNGPPDRSFFPQESRQPRVNEFWPNRECDDAKGAVSACEDNQWHAGPYERSASPLDHHFPRDQHMERYGEAGPLKPTRRPLISQPSSRSKPYINEFCGERMKGSSAYKMRENSMSKKHFDDKLKRDTVECQNYKQKMHIMSSADYQISNDTSLEMESNEELNYSSRNRSPVLDPQKYIEELSNPDTIDPSHPEDFAEIAVQVPSRSIPWNGVGSKNKKSLLGHPPPMPYPDADLGFFSGPVIAGPSKMHVRRRPPLVAETPPLPPRRPYKPGLLDEPPVKRRNGPVLSSDSPRRAGLLGLPRKVEKPYERPRNGPILNRGVNEGAVAIDAAQKDLTAAVLPCNQDNGESVKDSC